MKLAPVMLAFAVIGCGKASNRRGDDEGSKSKPEPAKVVTDPACLAKTKAFAPWFAGLMLEKRSYELDFGYTLVATDRSPSPVPHAIDAVEITTKHLGAWDASEANHVDSPLGDKPDDAMLLAVLKTDRAKLSPAEGYQHGADDTLRLDIDKGAPWSQIVRVVHAAKAAGYARVIFAFTAKTVIEQPPGTEAHTTKADDQKAADDALDARGKQCRPFDSAMMHAPDPAVPAEQDAKAWSEKVAAGLAECNCAADPDEVKKLLWQSTRWGQAVPRVGATIELGEGGVVVVEPADAPWSGDPSAMVLAATTDKQPQVVNLELKK